MQTYIAMLRGINVSGHRKVPMAELKQLLKGLHFRNVRTYIQSGNVVFETENINLAEIATQIEQAIAQQYGFEVPVLLRTPEELRQAIASNPFRSENSQPDERVYVTFMDQQPDPALLSNIDAAKYHPDRFIAEGRELYVLCPGGYGNTKLSNSFFESKLKQTATTRNWKTLNELVKMAG